MQDITFDEFYKGIGESEFEGNGDITNCDISWDKGKVRIGWGAVGTTSVFQGYLIDTISNPAINDQVWTTDNVHDVFIGTASTNTWSLACRPNDTIVKLMTWKDYLFLAAQTNLYTYGPLSGSAVLSLFQTIDSDGLWHPMIVGQDDILYGGAGRYVFSLQEKSGLDFTPSTAVAVTYTWNSRALDLPEDYRIRCLGESGENLMIGTWKGTNIYDKKVADIFPWDRIADSFKLPIRFAENGIQAMINDENLLYFVVGLEGKLMVTDGTNVKELSKIPQHVADLTGGFTEVYPNSMIFHNNKIIFASYKHIWGYDIKENTLTVENLTSATANIGRIYSLLSTTRENYLVAQQDLSAVNRMDLISNASRLTSYLAYVTTPYKVIGTDSKPAILSEIEINLARPLASGQGVRLKYRTDLSASFTTIDTFDFANYGASQSTRIPFRLEVGDGIQIRAELTTGTNSTTSPELTTITLR